MFKLFEQFVHFLHGRTCTHCNTAFAAGFEQGWVGAFFRGHRVDDGFHFAHRFFGCAFGDLFRYLTQFARHFRHQVFQATHIAHLLDLFFKIVEVEAFAFLQLFRHFGGGFFINAFLNIFNQGQYVAHAEDTAGKTVGVERFEAVDFLADTDKFNRFAGYMAYGQCRTAARITVHLGQYDAGQRQGFIKCLSSVHRILAQHGIDDEQSFNRVDRRMKRFDFVHHLFIDCQATGGIDHQYIVKMFFGVIDGGSRNLNRFLVGIGREKVHTNLFCQQAQLFNRSRAVNVGRYHQDFFLLIVFQQAGEFADGCCFTGTLQTGHQNDGRR